LTAKRFRRKVIKCFFREQWSLLVCGLDGKTLVHIVPPKNHIWADPFPVHSNGKTYIFTEQQIAYNNGTLGYLELYPDLSYSKFFPILEKKYHLSFPHIFSVANNGQKTWYMTPESHENKTIDLYKSTDFPGIWIHETTLMNNVDAVDSVVFPHGGKWWLFTSIGSKETPANQNLSAFYADTFPSNAWTPHPQNPISRDPANSRMAGAVFINTETGALNRPAQSCIKEYGEKTHINEIIELSPVSYRERIIKTILPERNLHAVCTHTINYSERYIVRDIKTRRLKILSGI
jgi:hypothetical protein